MPSDPRLAALLLRWEELADAGKSFSAAELCRDCPELEGALAARIAALRRFDWMKNERETPTDNGRPANGANAGPTLTAGSEPVPGYKLIRRLGRGGFGEAWQAEGPGGFPVALKCIERRVQQAEIEQRALELMRGVRHAHLLSVFGVWQTDDWLIIALELADRTLADRLREVRTAGEEGIPGPEVHGYLRQAAEAIDFLNREHAIQHRDIKPQNLFLVGTALKVGDFSLARELRHSVTEHTGNLTMAYAAPEFFEGHTTRHSDQYCLAISYCELRAGRLPFAGTAARIMAGHLHGDPDLTMLPDTERPIVAKALAKNATDRWPSCGAFMNALVDGATVGRISNPAAPQPDRKSSLQRMPVRPLLVIAAALTALTVIALAVIDFAGRQALTAKQDRNADKNGTLLVEFEWPAEISAARGPRCLVPSVYGDLLLANLDYGPATKEDPTHGVPILWSVTTGNIIRRFPTTGGPAAAFAPYLLQNAHLLTGNDAGEVALWDSKSGQKLQTFKGHEPRSVSSVAYSPDGSKVLTASCDQTIRLWDRASGEQLKLLRGHESIVMSALFLPTGQQVLSAGFDATLRLWDLKKGEELRQFTGHRAPVWCLALSSDGRLAASGSEDRTARLWDVASGRELYCFPSFDGEVRSVAFDSQDRRLVVGAFGSGARVYDLRTRQEIWLSPLLHHAGTTVAAFRPGSSSDLFLSGAGVVQLWRISE